MKTRIAKPPRLDFDSLGDRWPIRRDIGRGSPELDKEAPSFRAGKTLKTRVIGVLVKTSFACGLMILASCKGLGYPTRKETGTADEHDPYKSSLCL
jgi:hypothetical protein